jgi:hypothetical protein
MRPSSALGAILISAGLVLAFPEAACACSCVGVTDEEAFDGAAAVFTGTLVDDGTPVFGRPGGIRTLEFEVDDVYKGEVAELQGIATAGDGAGCGWELPAGEDYLVFATISDGQLFASLCGGSRAVEEGDAFLLDQAAVAPVPGEADLNEAPTWPFVAGAVALIAAVTVVVWWRVRRRPGGGPDAQPAG